jgi:aspartate/methionine/tyrosine aminotransferase
VLFYTAGNVASVVQYGGIGALEGSQACIEEFRAELRARRDLFYRGIRELASGVFSGHPPPGAFYGFLRIDPAWSADGDTATKATLSWRMTEYLIKNGRIGCIPGVDFGANGEGYVRFCLARERRELSGAVESMKQLFDTAISAQSIDTSAPTSGDGRRRRARFHP